MLSCTEVISIWGLNAFCCVLICAIVGPFMVLLSPHQSVLGMLTLFDLLYGHYVSASGSGVPF